MQKLLTFFQQKSINVFAIFQDKHVEILMTS